MGLELHTQVLNCLNYRRSSLSTYLMRDSIAPKRPIFSGLRTRDSSLKPGADNSRTTEVPNWWDFRRSQAIMSELVC